MRILTFSKVFPKKHPLEGDPTDFAIKILDGRKKHTIRAGQRWKVGDFFNARQWADKPYKSKQVSIADGMPVEKTWRFEISPCGPFGERYFLNDKEISGNEELLKRIAENDGLTLDEFVAWFPMFFDGQIICWDNSVNY